MVVTWAGVAGGGGWGVKTAHRHHGAVVEKHFQGEIITLS